MYNGKTVRQECLVHNVPPTTRRIVESIGRFLHPRCDVGRIACFFRRDLAYDVTRFIIGLTLKESGLEIYVRQVPQLVSCKLNRKTETWTASGRTISLLDILLTVLETSEKRALHFRKFPSLSLSRVRTHRPVT